MNKNLEIEPEHFLTLNNILGRFTEMMSDDEDDEEMNEEDIVVFKRIK